MNQLEEKNDTRSMMKGNYSDKRLDKSNELNESMTLNQSSRDEYTNKIHNLGGSSD
ncbi:MAG: hypothetical protein L0K90_01885 [Staphylococcus equorum]|nr:hypothetical protein [Staphylococcus equorum]MDN6629990.1 hypothetical protein [Staphylococcus equorum]